MNKEKSLGIDTGHHMLDGAVFVGGIHGLKNQQHRITVVCVEQILQSAQFLDVCTEDFLGLFLRLGAGLGPRRPDLEFDMFSGPDPERCSIDFHPCFLDETCRGECYS